MPIRLGELLLKESMVSPQQLQDALDHAKRSGCRIAKAFVILGFVSDKEITSLLSRRFGVPSIDLDHFEVDPAIIRTIPAETARKYQVLPLSRSKATLTIAMADPTNVFAMDDIKFMTGYNVEPVVASESALEDAIERYYGSNRPLDPRRDTAPPTGGFGNPTRGCGKDQGCPGRLDTERRRHGSDRRALRDRPRLAEQKPKQMCVRSSPRRRRSTLASWPDLPVCRRPSS